jgi:hypothetical protein
MNCLQPIPTIPTVGPNPTIIQVATGTPIANTINAQALNDPNFMGQAQAALAQRGYFGQSPQTQPLPIIQRVTAEAASAGMSLEQFEAAIVGLLAAWPPAAPQSPMLRSFGDPEPVFPGVSGFSFAGGSYGY